MTMRTQWPKGKLFSQFRCLACDGNVWRIEPDDGSIVCQMCSRTDERYIVVVAKAPLRYVVPADDEVTVSTGTAA